jgi:hypothetical protein
VNSHSRRAIIHRTVRCTPDSVRCSKRTRLWNLAASGIYNGCSAIIHRTCPVYTGLSGVTAGQRLFRRQRLPAAHLLRASARRSQARPYWRTGHSTVHVRCTTGHPGGPRRQSSNGFGDVAGAPDMSGVPCDSQPHQTASLVVGAINSPNHPPFIASKFSTSQPLTRARHSILDTPKRSNPLQIPLKALVISERDLPCSFELLRLDCFFSFSLVLVIKTPL